MIVRNERSELSPSPTGDTATTFINNHHQHRRPRTQTMAPINMKRYDTSTHEIPPAPYAQPSGRTVRQRTVLPSQYTPIVPHPPAILSDPQTFPILPEQLERHLEQVQHRLTNNVPTQSSPASGSAPSPNPGQILVLNPPPAMIPTAHAFHAPTLGMPSTAEYLRFLTRYLDEMTPNKRGKALIDSELLKRIKLILALHHKGFAGSGETSSDSESAPPVPYGTGGSWDTQAFRRWVRSTFVSRPATRTELERAIDFGLLSPPESSLSGPGVPGHAPSAGLTRSRNLVFHEDRPVALRSRAYKIILRAHWVANHAGRDRTWAMVREVCSYIPKCLVYDFVAACPTCRVARSGQYGIYTGTTRGISAANVEKLLKFGRKLHNGSQNKGDTNDSSAGHRLPPILPAPPCGMPLEGRVPQFGPNTPLHSCPTPMSTYPPQHLHANATIVEGATSDPLGPIRLPPLPFPSPPPISIQPRAEYRSQQLNRQNQDLQGAQRETPVLERRDPSWMRISKLIERAARNEQGEDVDLLVDSSVLRRDGSSAREDGVEFMMAGVGRETMVNTFPRVAPP